jgi:hypothetical protein
MAKCKKCNVTVDSTSAKCPLCFSAVQNPGTDTGINPAAYPGYNIIQQEVKRFTLKKLLLFLSIVSGVICFAVNLLTWAHGRHLWSAIIIVSLFSCWSFFRAFHSKRVNAAGRILLFYIFLVLILLNIDANTGFRMWSTTYVLPFLTIAAVLGITVLSSLKKRRQKDELGYLLAALLISVCPLFLFLFSLSLKIWTSVASLVYSLLTVVGLYIFSGEDFKAEMKKRFHL